MTDYDDIPHELNRALTDIANAHASVLCFADRLTEQRKEQEKSALSAPPRWQHLGELVSELVNDKDAKTDWNKVVDDYIFKYHRKYNTIVAESNREKLAEADETARAESMRVARLQKENEQLRELLAEAVSLAEEQAEWADQRLKRIGEFIENNRYALAGSLVNSARDINETYVERMRDIQLKDYVPVGWEYAETDHD